MKLSLVSAGIAWVLAWGCGSVENSKLRTSGTTSSGSTTATASGAGGDSPSSGTSSSMTGVIMTTGSGSGTGGSGNIADANCGATRQSTKQIPTDVFIMQDKSASMDCLAADDACTDPVTPMPPSRWDAMGTALSTFVDAPAPAMAGVAIGIGFFGLKDGSVPCNANSYTAPVVDIAALPGNAMPIKSAIAATMPSEGTPTAPALQGAIEYARQYTMQEMGKRTAAVLLVTDGNPTGCEQSGVTQAIQAAAQGYLGTPQIKTFVVGMGNTAALDQVALAGSGGMTHYIPTHGDVVGTLTQALTAISGMITCIYPIPAGSDPRLVNVEITVGMGGAPTRIGKVDNIADCGKLGGWYYDDPMMPSQINFCPQSCDPLKTTPNSGVEILYGCPSTPPPR